MGVQRRVHRPVQFDFPGDFPERLECFKQKSGLSWKALARLMGVKTLPAVEMAPGHPSQFDPSLPSL